MARFPFFALLIFPFAFFACQKCDEKARSEKPLFELLEAKKTGIDFENTLTYDDQNNCYTFRNFYNGGGVGIGDVNNDGLADLFFCGNQVGNRLYLNRGDWKFEDVTQKAGLSSQNVWTTGVALVDLNGDGWLDIYCCKSGDPKGERRANELFINKKDGTFEEAAAEWGLDNRGLSSHAAFFDYDRDGDLDCYLLNNSLRSVGGYDLIKDQRNRPDPEGGNKLLRNDASLGERWSGPFSGKKCHVAGKILPFFTDVTAEAGIFSSAIGFGLGVAVSDFDRDGWPDLYVSNDFFERDYFYRNLGNGKFEEVLESKMSEISMGSMGADIADLTNDGWPEVFVTEMLPRDDARLKSKAQFDSWNRFSLAEKTGYGGQFGRNVLQLNRGDGTFAEVGRMTKTDATDWSWGALLADFDLDGWKDIFIANGIGKDLLDQDYLNFYADPQAVQQVLKNNPGKGIVKLIDAMPSQKLPNFLFKNTSNALPSREGQGGVSFENMAEKWGLAQPSFSNGSAYGDLDNDGDLDLVVNNVNQPAFVYKNKAIENGANSLTVNLSGRNGKSSVIGSKVTVWAGGQQFYQELFPMRGFLSCVDSKLIFGLGGAKKADSIEIIWPYGSRSFVKNNIPEKIIEYNFGFGLPVIVSQDERPKKSEIRPPFSVLPFSHLELDFNDFDREPLGFQMLSTEGPCLARGDFDGDGHDDFFIGGGAEQAGATFFPKIVNRKSSFVNRPQPAFEKDKAAEDVAALAFDADGDKDLDLWVGSGSSEFAAGDARLDDRIYLNDGKGHFSRAENALPRGKPVATSALRATDFDHDGDTDVFVATRSLSGSYGVPTGGFLMENDGRGNFRPSPQSTLFRGLGMLTDAAFLDINKDGFEDLVIVGDWLEPHLFLNEKGKFRDASAQFFEPKMAGWWSALLPADVDGDGDMDLIAGNHGQNSRLRCSADRPASLFVSDFDENGSTEAIFCQFNTTSPLAATAKSYPYIMRNDLVRQLPSLKKRFLKFDDYANQPMEAIFSKQQLEKALKLEAFEQRTGIFRNENGRFVFEPLPFEAQLAPVFALAFEDFDGDGKGEIALGGNHFRCKPETGSFASSRVSFFKKDEKTDWRPMADALKIEGAVRDFLFLNRKLIVARSGAAAVLVDF